MATKFASVPNNVQTTLGADYTAASGTMTLATGYGATLAARIAAAGFAAVSANAPLRFTVVAASALNSYGQVLDVTKVAVFTATGLAGDVLSGVAVAEGTTDQPFAAGSVVMSIVTAAQLAIIQAAINALENAPAGGMTIGAAVSGGTAGAALRVDAAGKLAQGGVYIDPTTQRVGVVTTTPNAIDPYARVAVVDTDSAVVSMFLKNTGSGQAQYYVANATGVQWRFGLLGGDAFLHIGTSSTTWLTIRHDTGQVTFAGPLLPPTFSDAAAASFATGTVFLGSDHLDTDGSPKLCRKGTSAVKAIG